MGRRAQRKREEREQEQKSRKKLRESLYLEKNPWATFWRRIDFWIYTVCLLALFAFPIINRDQIKTGERAIIHTSMGDITVKLYPKEAPNTVKNFAKLSNEGFYNNLLWHRVIKGFIIQSGDPNGDGTGGPGYQFNDEINAHPIVQGTLAMANSGENTNGSQFFIVTDGPQSSLDGKYTVFGDVLSGIEVVKKISEVPTDSGTDKPIDAVYLESVEMK